MLEIIYFFSYNANVRSKSNQSLKQSLLKKKKKVGELVLTYQHYKIKI
jgi:hypothetical protein